MERNQPSEEQRKFIQEMAGPNFQVTQSIYHALYIANQGDVDKMTDELLNLIHDPIAEARRQEEEQRKKREQEEARRFLEKRREEDERKRQEEQRREEILKQQDELLRQAEANKKKEEERRREEERKRLEEERRRQQNAEQERLRKEQEKKFLEEQLRLEEEYQRRVAEAEERRRREAEAEERRRREEEERRQREAELERRIREQLRKEMEEAEERKRREEEEARKRLEEEQKRREEEERLRKEEEEKRRKEEEKKNNEKRSEEDRKRLEEMEKVYQRKLDELQARLRELESAHKNSEGKKQEKKEEQVPQTPKVCVLVDQSVAQERVDEAVGYLQEKADVKKEEIQIVDASKDFELIGVVKGQREKIEYPMVLIRDSVIGTVEELKAYGEKGMLPAILAGEKPDTAASAGKNRPAELQLSFLDHTVSFAVSTVQGIGTLVFLPIIAPYKLFSWAFGSSKPKLPEGVDVDVIQSNWYWRHQLRTLRFTKDSILRLRPGYEDIRAAHKYEDVKEIKLVDDTNLVISYRQGGADYLRTTPENVRLICDLITKRSPNPPAIIKPTGK